MSDRDDIDAVLKALTLADKALAETRGKRGFLSDQLGDRLIDLWVGIQGLRTSIALSYPPEEEEENPNESSE